MDFDLVKFFTGYRLYFKERLSQSQVDGIKFLLSSLANDFKSNLVNNIEQAAYILATVKHETANTFQPIEEYGKGIGKPYGVPDPQTKQIYYGRGYVQLTWKNNYKVLGKYLGVDLVNKPELACSPSIAYKILVVGLDKGLFGKSIDEMINSHSVDFLNARRTVNGMDKANLIAHFAQSFLSILKESIMEGK